MDLRTGASAVERGTRPRPLRGTILARPSPSCTHDNDRLRLPSATSPQKSAAGKKESTDRRRNQACQPSVTPSSRSSLDCHRNAARTAKGGSARRCGVNKYAKVVLVCGRRPSDPHHLRFAQSRALGRKVSDEFTVPLCRVHHREAHRSRDERAWWRRLGLDSLKIAEMLWKKTRLADSKATS